MKKLTPASHQLHVFAALARRRSFTRAAIDLGCTQSAVSHALSTLEANLGICLCRYLKSQVRLTPAGVQVLRSAKIVLRELRTIRALAHQISLSRARARGAGLSPRPLRSTPRKIAAAAALARFRRAA